VPALDLIVRARRVVTSDGERSASVGVLGGRIVSVGGADAELDARSVVELADDEVLLPGLVDTHVHVNEPGRTSWEGFATATRAAAAGGVTTIVDMPLNSVPPTTDVDALETKRQAARGQVHVDVGFWGGIVPGNLDRLVDLHNAGAFGFKCFLAPSGVDEFPPVSPDELGRALEVLGRVDALTIVHAEDPVMLAAAGAPSGSHYRDFLASRPAAVEDSAVATVVDLARRTAARLHVLHLSSAGAVPIIRAARREGLRVTAETCPHYLTLTAEEVPDGATTYKCCPPIREGVNRDALWRALADGTVSLVVSDHSPCTSDLKRIDTGDFGQAWGGIASLQLGLPVVLTEARRRGFGLPDVVRWMSESPARLAGLERKGRIAPGADADLCVLAPDESFGVDPARLHHRNPLTPYAGMRLSGVVRATYLRGHPVTGAEPRGGLLGRRGAG
jgi:allantoinase